MAKKINLIADTAYDVILNKILSFELMPGQTVSDFQLSQQLNMSRTPIREAIMRLMMEGLIEQGETKMAVSYITPKDIKEICEVREAIETKAVRLILKNGGLTEKQISELKEINKEMQGHIVQNNYSSNFDMDDKFHSTIVDYSGNERLAQYFDRMRMQIKRARWLTVLKQRYNESIIEHDRIIDALSGSNLSDALNAIDAHLYHAADNFNAVLGDPSIAMLMKSIQIIHHNANAN